VPSKDAIPTSNIKDTTDLNLPYQPKDPNVLDSGLIPPTTPEEQKIDWSKVPFVPFKTPELPPAPDPVI